MKPSKYMVVTASPTAKNPVIQTFMPSLETAIDRARWISKDFDRDAYVVEVVQTFHTKNRQG